MTSIQTSTKSEVSSLKVRDPAEQAPHPDFDHNQVLLSKAVENLEESAQRISDGLTNGERRLVARLNTLRDMRLTLVAAILQAMPECLAPLSREPFDPVARANFCSQTGLRDSPLHIAAAAILASQGQYQKCDIETDKDSYIAKVAAYEAELVSTLSDTRARDVFLSGSSADVFNALTAKLPAGGSELDQMVRRITALKALLLIDGFEGVRDALHISGGDGKAFLKLALEQFGDGAIVDSLTGCISVRVVPPGAVVSLSDDDFKQLFSQISEEDSGVETLAFVRTSLPDDGELNWAGRRVIFAREDSPPDVIEHELEHVLFGSLVGTRDYDFELNDHIITTCFDAASASGILRGPIQSFVNAMKAKVVDELLAYSTEGSGEKVVASQVGAYTWIKVFCVLHDSVIFYGDTSEVASSISSVREVLLENFEHYVASMRNIQWSFNNSPPLPSFEGIHQRAMIRSKLADEDRLSRAPVEAPSPELVEFMNGLKVDLVQLSDQLHRCYELVERRDLLAREREVFDSARAYLPNDDTLVPWLNIALFVKNDIYADMALEAVEYVGLLAGRSDYDRTVRILLNAEKQLTSENANEEDEAQRTRNQKVLTTVEHLLLYLGAKSPFESNK